MFDRQYWLNNFRYPGFDINILPVWKKFPQLLDASYKGPRADLYMLDGGVYPHSELGCLDIAASKSFIRKAEGDALNDRIPHGTHLGGIVCAEANNEVGIAGIAGRTARLISFKIAEGSWNGSGPSTQGHLSDEAILEAMYWLLANVKSNQLAVVNASWGGFAYGQSLHEAVRANKRVVFVAASGNNFTSQVHYPCALPEVLCVSALDQYGQLAAFANYDDRVGILAYGETILSLYSTNDYNSLRGTSQATPEVAATAALLIWLALSDGADLSKISREMVIAAIKDGAKTMELDVSRTSGEKEFAQTRRLDVAGALAAFEKTLVKLQPQLSDSR